MRTKLLISGLIVLLPLAILPTGCGNAPRESVQPSQTNEVHVKSSADNDDCLAQSVDAIVANQVLDDKHARCTIDAISAYTVFTDDE